MTDDATTRDDRKGEKGSLIVRYEYNLTQSMVYLAKRALSDLKSNRALDILVADDDWTIRDMIAMVFGDLGHRCDQAESGEQVLEMTKARAYDLVTMDTLHRELTGLRVLRQLRARAGFCTPVAIISGNVGEDDYYGALGEGACAYIWKGGGQFEGRLRQLAESVRLGRPGEGIKPFWLTW